MKKKFIIVQDQPTVNKLIAAGFRIVSQVNGTYTFENIVPQHFNFSEIDKSKLAYTNMLSL